MGFLFKNVWTNSIDSNLYLAQWFKTLVIDVPMSNG